MTARECLMNADRVVWRAPTIPFQQGVQPSLTQKSGSGRAYVDNMPGSESLWSPKTSARWRRFWPRRHHGPRIGDRLHIVLPIDATPTVNATDMRLVGEA